MSIVSPTLTHQAAARQVWDCVVIGAGPAGAMAAMSVADRGLSCLLLERAQMPRYKVCGGCVNPRAVSLLNAAGLPELLADCGACSLTRSVLHFEGNAVELPLTGSVAISREALDSALVRAAVDRRVQYLDQTAAKVLPMNAGVDCGGSVELALRSATAGQVVVETQTVIAADGLAHPSLSEVSGLARRSAAQARIGAGATVVTGATSLRESGVHMAVSRSGYVGLVELEDGRVIIAAAVDPDAVRHSDGLAAAVQSILCQSGGPQPPELLTAQWKGTLPMTCRTRPVAMPRLFLIGDAAGYAEPFSGEGIAWALEAGARIGEWVELAMSDPRLAADGWIREWNEVLQTRQRWSSRIARLLHHPLGVRLAVAALAWRPQLANMLTGRMYESIERNTKTA